MNILFINIGPFISANGGVQRVSENLTKGFIAHGHTVKYLVANTQPDYYRPEACHNQFFINPSSPNWQDKFLEFIVEHKIDLVINQCIGSITSTFMKHVPSNVAKISVLHIQPFYNINHLREIYRMVMPTSLRKKLISKAIIACPAIFKLYFKRREIKMLNNELNISDQLVVLSQQVKTSLLKNLSDNIPDKIHVIGNPNTFKEEDFNPMVEKEDLIIYVGRLADVNKNVHGFIDMWKKLSDKVPHYQAAIIGDGKMKDSLERYAQQMNVERLCFYGNQKDIKPFYSKAKFVCLTSRSEGWGMALTEGMTMGCIPVCFNSISSCYELIDNGKNGIISHNLDAEEMASQIFNVISNPHSLEIISANAREKAKQFSVDNITKQWELLFSKLGYK